MVLDLDPLDSGGDGIALVFPDFERRLGFAIPITLRSEKQQSQKDIRVYPFEPGFGRVITEDEAKQRYPNVTWPTRGDLTVTWDFQDVLTLDYKHGQGGSTAALLERQKPGTVSLIEPRRDVNSWRDFKEYAAGLKDTPSVFRGQAKPWPLQTSFHRTARKCLQIYLDRDIPILHRAVTGRTKHIFDLDRPQQFGAFLNMAQHFGFPTPLLDWTYSPYVAAWFAFDSLSDRVEQGDKVRIFILDREGLSNCPRSQNLTYATPHLSVLEALAIENERMVPQQGLLTLTNMQDIEKFLTEQQQILGTNLIQAIDLPAVEAEVALNEMKLMGITRSVLFPGVESICSDLSESLFG